MGADPNPVLAVVVEGPTGSARNVAGFLRFFSQSWRVIKEVMELD